jgi:hypothetical protein
VRQVAKPVAAHGATIPASTDQDPMLAAAVQVALHLVAQR